MDEEIKMQDVIDKVYEEMKQKPSWDETMREELKLKFALCEGFRRGMDYAQKVCVDARKD